MKKADIPATRKDIDDVLQVMRKDTDEVLQVMRDFMQLTDERLNEMHKDIIDLKASHDRLLNTIDSFIGRIDQYETEQAARDNQFERLLEWARKVSAKTGIPLENL